MSYMYQGKKIGSYEDSVQTRTCSKCNKVEERTV
jgi:hypothetical protein